MLRLALDLICAFLTATAASCTRPVLRPRFGGDWYEQALRAIGVLSGLLWQVRVFRRLPMENTPIRVFVAGLLSFAATWAGSIFARGFLVLEKGHGT